MPGWLEPLAWIALVSFTISLGLVLHALVVAGRPVECERAAALPLPANLAERERENAAHLRACARAMRENPYDPLAQAAMTVAIRDDDDLRAIWGEWSE